MCSDIATNCHCGSGHRSIKPGILSLSITEKRVWKDLERSFNLSLSPKAGSDIPVSRLTEVCGEPGRFPVMEDSHPEQAACAMAVPSSSFIKEPKSCLHVKPVICCFICQGGKEQIPFWFVGNEYEFEVLVHFRMNFMYGKWKGICFFCLC